MVPGEEPQFLSWSGAKGIYYRLAQDSRSWYFRGTIKAPHRSTPIRMSLGDVREPRLTASFLEGEAYRLRELCKQGIDPRKVTAAPEEPSTTPKVGPTWDEVWPIYLSTKVGISDTYRDDIDGKWRRSISPHIGSLRVDATGTHDIERMFDSFGTKVSTSVHIHRILRLIFPWAKRRYPGVQADLLDRPIARETPTQDRLWREEIIRFGAALRESDYVQKPNILFLLLTGARAGTLTHWDSSWVNDNRIEIPLGLEGLKHARTILITPPVANLIPKLVPCTNSALRNCVILLCRKAGIRPLSSHDLRRTYISEGCDLGIPEETMLALTGHVSKSQIGRIYNHASMVTRMPQALQVAEHLMNLLGDKGL